MAKKYLRIFDVMISADSYIEPDSDLGKLQSKLQCIMHPYLEKRSRQVRQPVEDFLFEYYSFSANKLMTFNPGFGSSMPADWIPSDKLYRFDKENSHWYLDAADFPEKRLRMLRWTITLLESIENRPQALGCFGLHEWAMVYRTHEVRHEQLPLRLGPDEIARTVDSQTIRCSHFDAFRFFTPDAVPLNTLQPTYDQRMDLEQGGCIHANMDLYKWVYKFHPWLPSDLLWKAFLLAREIRYFDMQASPYDLSEYGLEPVRIETPEGRKQYTALQKEFAGKSSVLRRDVIRQMRSLLDFVTS